MRQAADLNVTIAADGERVVLELVGELDFTTSQRLQVVLDRMLGRRHVPAVREVVLDVGELTFADVAGLSPVLHARAVLVRRGGRVELRRPRRLVQRLVRVLGLQDELLAPETAVALPAQPGERPAADPPARPQLPDAT